jgi:hypothetical protein
VCIAVPQVFAVPMIQRRINTLVRERVRTVRRAGDLVVDNMQGGGRSSASSRASEIGKAFEAIYGVRLRVFKLKFGLKFLVSGLQSVGVFALLFVCGIMVLNGKTEIGIVVAFISGLCRETNQQSRDQDYFDHFPSSRTLQADGCSMRRKNAGLRPCSAPSWRSCRISFSVILPAFTRMGAPMRR